MQTVSTLPSTTRSSVANPQDEEAILVGCLTSPRWRREAFVKILPRDFYFERHQSVFSGLLAAANPSDPLEVASHPSITQQDRPQVLDDLGRWLTSRAYADSDPDATIARVLDLSARRRAIALVENLNLDELARTDRPLAHTLNALIAGLSAVAPVSEDSSLRHGPDVIAEVLEEIGRRANGELSYLSTGFAALDELIGGWKGGRLIIEAARASMGKSAFMLALALGLIRQQSPTLVFSLEMSAAESLSRMLAAESRVPATAIFRSVPTRSDFEQITSTAARSFWENLWVSDVDVPLDAMVRQIRQFALEHPDCRAVFIDYLGLMARSDELVRELGRITRTLKRLARELDIDIVLLCQINRAVESRNNKRPMMSDLRDSGAIENDADAVIALYRDEYYNPETTARGEAEAIVLKNRNGPIGTVKLLFDPITQRFSEPLEPNHYGR